MKPAPTSAQIAAAEARYVNSMRGARESLARARLAARAAISRPSTLTAIAGAAGLLGFWIAWRRRSRLAARRARHDSRSGSLAATVGAYATQYALHYAPVVLQQIWMGIKQRMTAKQASAERSAESDVASKAEFASGHP